MKDIFFKDKSEYNSQLNPIQEYVTQLTHYISTSKQLPIDVARKKAITLVKTHFKDRNIKHFHREENGDRIVQDSTLMTYIKGNLADKNILVPTFTSYVNMGVKKSILSEFIFQNVRKRAIAKKESQKAKADGDMELSVAKNYQQNTMKIRNNSLSGVFSSRACVLHNPTAHNTLTSITRTITSLSNASNEHLISGNRYLPSPEDVLNYMVYMTTNIDLEAIQQTVAKFNLHLPTVEDTVEVLKYSTDLYFSDNNYYNTRIIPFLNNLNPYQLAMICYSGDLYHLRKFNDGFLRTLLSELLVKVESNETMQDPSILYDVDESVMNCIHTIFFTEVKGKGKDYAEMNTTSLASSLHKTAEQFISTLYKYQLFFNTFFMNEKMPVNSFRLKNTLRRCVVLSDTDSTCFTLDEWITWYKGDYIVTDETIGLAGVVSYVASQAIVNKLAILSSNMNVDKEFLHTLAMKNEYLWLTHITTELSKHYFAQTVIQEGNVFRKPDVEIKGVGLQSSAIPTHVIERGYKLMDYILESVSNNKKIKLNDVIRDIVGIETDIIDSVNRGEAMYLRKSKVNTPDAYSQDEKRSPYQRHTLWQTVFAPKYGEWQAPPYDCIKIPTTITSRTKLKDWLDGIEDRSLAERFGLWLEDHNKKDLPTMYINETYIQGSGIPDEILRVIDIKRIILDTTSQQRIILASLGVMLDDNFTVGELFKIEQDKLTQQ